MAILRLHFSTFAEALHISAAVLYSANAEPQRIVANDYLVPPTQDTLDALHILA
jgi:hypothetical protein